MQNASEWIKKTPVDIWKTIVRYALPQYVYVLKFSILHLGYFEKFKCKEDEELWIEELYPNGDTRVIKVRCCGFASGEPVFMYENHILRKIFDIIRIERYEFKQIRSVAYLTRFHAIDAISNLKKLYPSMDIRVERVEVVDE